MSDESDPISTGRTSRNEALERLTSHFGKLRSGLQERPIGQRLADEAIGKAKGMGQEALEIAKDSKGILAATAGALALWLFRKPLSRGVQGLLPRIRNWRGKEDDCE